MKTRFIYNPCSGGNRRRPGFLAELQEFVRAGGPGAGLACTERPGHATELAGAAVRDGCDHVVVIGGDGTINEAAQALVGASASLAIVPAGSGNGLALHLGLPPEPRRALAQLQLPGARTVSIDTGTANGVPFFNVMGVGFDAELSRRVNLLRNRGLAAYVRSALAAYAGYRDLPVGISDGAGAHLELDALFVSVGNSDQYGNRARFAPGARVDDGLLDLVAVRRPGVLGIAPLVARLFLGTFRRDPRVSCLRSGHFVIRRPAAGLMHTDGEVHETGATVEVTVRPRSLRLVVPAGCQTAAEPSRQHEPDPSWKRNASRSAR